MFSKQANASVADKEKKSLKKALRRAFTITELVIVIAVIAILAAVLIPTFTSLINRANQSADTQTVKNLNTILASEEAFGNRAETIDEALAQALEGGYKVENLTPTGEGYDIVWDQTNNRFALVDASGKKIYGDASTPDNISGQEYWKITDDASKTTDNAFSWYLTEDALSSDGGTVESYEITSSTSLNLSAFTDLKTVTISDTATGEINLTTNSEDVEISIGTTSTANSATVNLYGTAGMVGASTTPAGQLFFGDFGNNSLHIYGTVDTVLAKGGKIVINENAKVEKLLVLMNQNSWTYAMETPENLTIEKKDGATLNALYGVTTSSLDVATKSAIPADFSELIQNSNNADGSNTIVNSVVFSSNIKSFESGIGTQENPFLISEVSQLNLTNQLGGADLYFKLVNDITMNTQIQFTNGNRTLDIGNNTITVDIQNKSSYCAFLIASNTNFTINSGENGRIVSTATTTADCIFVVGNTTAGKTPGSLTINDGTFEARSIARADYGTISIYGGNFNYTDTYNGVVWLLNYLDSSTYEKQILVYGGVFEDFNPSAPDNEQGNVNMVADNYKVTETEVSGTKYYTVSPAA